MTAGGEADGPRLHEVSRHPALRPYALLASLSGLAFALGLFASWARTSFPAFAPAPNPLGIISRTTDAGYPKGRDVAILGSGILACLLGIGAAKRAWILVAQAMVRLAGGKPELALGGASLSFLPLGLVLPWLLRDPTSWPTEAVSAVAVAAATALVATLFTGERGEDVVAFARGNPHAPVFVVGTGLLWGLTTHLWNGSRSGGGGWSYVSVCAGPLAALAAWIGLARFSALRQRMSCALFLAPSAHALAPTLVLGLYPFLYFDRHPVRILLTVALPWTAWRTRAVISSRPDPDGPSRVLAPYVVKLLLPVVLCLLALEPAYRDHPLGRDMMFYAEEGQHLAWANRILHGQVPGRDFFMLYGPLMEYGHALWLRLFGVTTAESRAYFEALRLAGVVAAYAFGRAFYKGSTMPVLASIALVVFGISPRVAFGLVPLWAAFRAAELDEKGLLRVAGIATAALGIFSQEVAIAAALSLAAFVLLDPLGRVEGVTAVARRIAAGALLLAVPVILWLALRGALAATFENLVTYPRYVTLGYANSPFPSLCLGTTASFYLRSLFGFATPAIWYIPPVIALAAIATAVPAGLGNLDARRSRRLAVAIFGLVLFRSALGRSGPGKIYYVMPPAILLLFSFLEEAWEGARRRGPIAIALSAVMACYLVVPSVLARIDFFVTRFGSLRGPEARGFVMTDLPRMRAGAMPPDKAGPLVAAVRHIDETIGRDEPMLAIPNDAALYFLADRCNPTRFDLFSQIVTDAHRHEVRRDLERHPPALVVYDVAITRVDGIADARQFPGALSLLYDRYELRRRIGPFLMLGPAAHAEPPATAPVTLQVPPAAPCVFARFDGVIPRWHTLLDLETTFPRGATLAIDVKTSTDAFQKSAVVSGGHLVIDLADQSSWAFGGKPERITIQGTAAGRVAAARLLPRSRSTQ